jgi:hypothetical protein
MKEVAYMEEALKQLKERGRTFAEAERDYKVAMRTEILKLRDEGKPATLILQLCYGTPNIAKLRLDRDIAEAMYKSAQEAINVKKLKIRIMENQYDREYSHYANN